METLFKAGTLDASKGKYKIVSMDVAKTISVILRVGPSFPLS